jgi:Domain of unknown function DUF29
MTRGSNPQTLKPQPTRPLYDQDLALWIEEQVAALRADDVAALDVPNLIEDLQGLTKRDERGLGSQLKRIMAHLLKRRHQPQRAGPGRADPIASDARFLADDGAGPAADRFVDRIERRFGLLAVSVSRSPSVRIGLGWDDGRLCEGETAAWSTARTRQLPAH